MLELDHVIFAVADFDEAAARLLADHGLASVPGGAHPGHGTGNRIVPLGSTYLELMAVVDAAEAEKSPLGRWVGERVAAGGGPAALCLRTDDVSSVAARLGLEPLAMSRLRPDGVELSWHLVGLEQMLTEGFPFFIQWHVPRTMLPGASEVAHQGSPGGLEWVELGGSRSRVDSWLGAHDLDLRIAPGRAGVHRVGIGSGAGQIVI